MELRENLRLLPQTPYSVTEIDQGVALTVGIVTLLFALREIIKDSRFCVDQEFECWKTRCLQNIEHGDTGVEIARWTKELECMDKKAKCERTRTRHREREAKTLGGLPKDVKECLDDYIRLRQTLRSLGFRDGEILSS